MRLIFTLLFSAGYFLLSAQTLVSVEDRGTQSLAVLQSQFGPFIQYGVEMKKLTYETIGIDGQLDTASGLFIFPDVHDQRYPMGIYQHGTVDGPADVPSELAGGWQLAAAAAGMGYVVSAPDFLGLGESRGFHPYVDPVTEARAAIDMLGAAQEYADTNDEIFYNDQLFITGYSQGGHASAAAHRAIEEDPNSPYTVTAAAHLSGPYSISKEMVEFTVGSDEPYGFVAYLPYTALSLRETNPGVINDLEEIFLPDYVPLIEEFYQGNIGLFDLNDQLINKLIQDFGTNVPNLMIQDSIVNALLNDPTHPFSAALTTYDVADWTPQAPTRLYYCTGDDQVTFRNSVYADSLMNANGAPDVEAIDVDNDADHGECVFPAAFNTFLFFGAYANIEAITSTAEVRQLEQIQFGPQPADQEVWVRNLPAGVTYQLFNQLGQPVATGALPFGSGRVEVGSLSAGTYFVRLEKNGQSATKRLLIVR